MPTAAATSILNAYVFDVRAHNVRNVTAVRLLHAAVGAVGVPAIGISIAEIQSSDGLVKTCDDQYEFTFVVPANVSTPLASCDQCTVLTRPLSALPTLSIAFRDLTGAPVTPTDFYAVLELQYTERVI